MKRIIILFLITSPSLFGSPTSIDSLAYYKEKVMVLESRLSAKNSTEEKLKYEFGKKEAALKMEQEKKEVIAQMEAKKMRSIIYILFAAMLCAVGFSIYIVNKLKHVA